MALRKEQLLTHHKDDDGLVQDLKQVLHGENECLSHLVASRTDKEKTELSRILEHLPSIRETRKARGAARQQTPQGTPRMSGTPRTPPTQLAGMAVVGAGSGAGTPRTPRTPRMSGTPRGMAEQPAKAVEKMPTLPESPANANDDSFAPVSMPRKPQPRPTSSSQAAEAKATERVKAQLAEVGIDPEGMTAGDILRIFYARGSGSSYFIMNREADKRLPVSERFQIPQSFDQVLTGQAHEEMMWCHNLPPARVHEHIDKWEVGFMGDICRSMRYFDEATKGHSTEYMRQYQTRSYGGIHNKRLRPHAPV